MPTVEHEIRGQFLREHGFLAAKLLGTLGITVPKWTKCEIGESSTTQAKPVVSAADAVLVYKDAENKAVFVIVVEIQRSKKQSKITRWPLYATTLADRYGCLAIVLVLASTPSIGRWAKKLDYSYGSVSFEPRILDATTVPAAKAESSLGETIISAWVRSGSAEVDEAIKLAIGKLKCREDFDWLISGFAPKIQRRVEEMMGAQEYRWFDVIVEERAAKAAVEIAAKAVEKAEKAEKAAMAAKEATSKAAAEAELFRAKEQIEVKRDSAQAAVTIAKALEKIAEFEKTESALAESQEAQKQAELAQVAVQQAETYFEEIKEKVVQQYGLSILNKL